MTWNEKKTSWKYASKNSYDRGQNLWNSVKKSSKIGHNEKTLKSVFAQFLTSSTKVLFLEERLVFLGSLQVLRQLAYNVFALYIMYHFPCGESNLDWNLKIFHNFMSAIVGKSYWEMIKWYEKSNIPEKLFTHWKDRKNTKNP